LAEKSVCAHVTSVYIFTSFTVIKAFSADRSLFKVEVTASIASKTIDASFAIGGARLAYISGGNGTGAEVGSAALIEALGVFEEVGAVTLSALSQGQTVT
jgi:hypothetical protein